MVDGLAVARCSAQARSSADSLASTTNCAMSSGGCAWERVLAGWMGAAACSSLCRRRAARADRGSPRAAASGVSRSPSRGRSSSRSSAAISPVRSIHHVPECVAVSGSFHPRRPRLRCAALLAFGLLCSGSARVCGPVSGRSSQTDLATRVDEAGGCGAGLRVVYVAADDTGRAVPRRSSTWPNRRNLSSSSSSSAKPLVERGLGLLVGRVSSAVSRVAWRRSSSVPTTYFAAA